MPMETLANGRFKMKASNNRGAVATWASDGVFEILSGRSLRLKRRVAFGKVFFEKYAPRTRSSGPSGGDNARQLRERALRRLRTLDFAFDSDAARMALSGPQPGSSVWLVSGKEEHEMAVTPSAGIEGVSFVSLSSDGRRLAVGGYGSACEIIDTEHLSSATVYRGHESVEQGLFIQWIEFSYDGSLVATANEGLCAVWEPKSGDTLSRVEGCTFARFSPDGSEVLATDRKECFWWRLSGGEKAYYAGHEASVVAATWSPSGDQIASGDQKGRVHVWRKGDGLLLDSFGSVFGSPVRDICWVQAGVLVLFADGIVARWAM